MVNRTVYSLFFLVLPALVLAETSTKTSGIKPPQVCSDADDDGYGIYPETSTFCGCRFDGVDCDDDNAEIHPFRDEVCGDGVDNNCRHGIDEGCGPAPAFDGWRVMPVRTQGQFERGEVGGRAEQWLQGAARCRGNPDIIYLSHDCGQIWRSEDGGQTWGKPLCHGLLLKMGQSIEVDPADCDRIVMIVDNSYDYRRPDYAGIYISEDGGNHFEFVQAGPTLQNRRYEHNVAWAASSVDAKGTRRWYAALYNEAGEPNNEDSAIFVSDDYGHSWTPGASLQGHDPVYELQVSPADQELLIVASNQGLQRSTDGGASISPLGDLPTGEVTSVAFDPGDDSIVYAVVRGADPAGVYLSEDGGQTFTRLTVADSEHQAVLDDARRIFIHPVNGVVFYVLPQSSDNGKTAIRTADGGSSFTITSISLPDDVRAWRWGLNFSGNFSFLLLSASDEQNVVAQSGGAALFRTSDGMTFVDASTLYTGANCGLTNYNIAFDQEDPDRFATGNADIGMFYTDNGADWFSDRGVPWEWIQNETVPWGSQYTIDLRPGSSTEVVGVAGYVFEKKPGHSQDNGQNWEIADDETGYYWRVAYHLFDTSVVYAGDKRSLDAGQSYQPLPVPSELNDDGLQVMDYCRAQPDIVYMASRDTRRILRSVDRGDTWELYAEPGWTVAPFDPKITFAVNPVHCNVIYTVDQDGDLARFDGAGWESLGVLNNVETPQGYFNYIRSVMVDPNHPEIIYAGIFGTGISSIFRSTDDGATWQDISYNRFRDEVGGINISPISGEVMVSGCSGTWVLPPPYPTNHGIYENLIPRPSCYDGLQNGDEQGIDCGGSCPDNCGDVDGGQPDGDGDDVDDDGDDGDGDDGDGGRPDAGADADLPDGADSAGDSAGDGGQTDGADSSGADNVGSRVEGDCGCGQRAALSPTPLLFLLLLTFPGLLRRRHERHGT